MWLETKNKKVLNALAEYGKEKGISVFQRNIRCDPGLLLKSPVEIAARRKLTVKDSLQQRKRMPGGGKRLPHGQQKDILW